MRTDRQIDIDQLFEQGTEIDKALGEAARQAREAHKREGLPLAYWRDGKTVLLAPEDVEAGWPEVRRQAGD